MQVNFSLVVFVLCLSCGTIAIVFRPTAVASWLFFTGMLLLAAELGLDYQVAKAASAAEISTWLWRGLLLKSLDPGIWLSFSLVYARGNQGEFLSHWKWFLVVAWLLPVALIFGFPQRVFESAESSNALAIQLGWAGKAWVMVVITAILAILVNFEKTFRASVGMARWRIKYLILGVGLIFGVRVYTLSQMLLFSGYRSEVANLTLVSLFLGCILNGVGQVRSSFGALDIYPSRAVLQGSVTVILAGAYFIIVGLLAQSVALLGGIANFPAQALVLLLGVVGVAVMMLSERFRMALRRFISCHFRRPEHDFREIWTEFTRRTSSVLDAVTLGKNAANVISESFHVLGVTVFGVDSEALSWEWLHSTEIRLGHVALQIDVESLRRLARRGRPIVLELEPDAWADVFRKSCPKKFQHGGDSLAVPLVAAERLVGLMVLVDRVNGVPYSHEELDLLKCIGDQLAGGLLNCALSDEVLQAKELESFQTLSTFFVHDLKNAATGLSLMLQNMPIHFDDPKFRSDAIQGVGRTVERINQLILKLSSLRREVQLIKVPCRLDLLCAEVLDGLETTMDGKRYLERDLRPVPLLALDAEAMRSVVTNLVVNAREALNGSGEVKVATCLEAKGVEFAVADSGCGMSPKFIKNLLFRPFHSTKTNGLGIGMFQCRKIVEAHGGTIAVKSEPGMGTRFAIWFPLRHHSQANQLLP